MIICLCRNVSSGNLNGTIPDSIGSLTQLKIL